MKNSVFPNPADRTKDEPADLISAKLVLRLYNIIHAIKVDTVTPAVKDWFLAEAKEVGWQKIEFLGNQALLVRLSF